MDVIFQFVQQTSLQKLIMAIFANLDKGKNQIQDTSSSSKSSQLNWNDRLFDFNLNPLFYFSFSSPKPPPQITHQIFLLFKPYSSTILLLPRSSSSTQTQFISQPFARDAARQWKGNGNITQASRRSYFPVKKKVKGR